MSAIGVVWHRQNRGDAGADVARMVNALSLYGSDRTGQWRDGNLAIGHCLMAVLPEDRFDRQPLVDGGVALTATARLDNRGELATLLGIAPARARGMADGEFILAAYLRWGEECPDRLLGDFSFAIWNRATQRLFCARDHMGRHPVVYFSSGSLFALASMPKGLFALPDIPRKLDEDEVIRRLRVAAWVEATPNQASVFAGLRTLPAGHCLSVTEGGETLRRYWAPDPHKQLRLSDDDCVEAFRELFDEAVRCRLRGVGEIGSHLSGGLDSAAVTVTAARLLAADNRRLTAFTAAPRLGYAAAGADGWPLDESHAAGLTAARHGNIDHVVLRPDGTTPLDAIRRYLFLADRQPVNPCNAVWDTQLNAEAKRRGIRVLLNGQLGNMTISYDGTPQLSALLRQGRWLALGGEIIALPARQHVSRVLRAVTPAPIWDSLKRSIRGNPPPHSALRPELLSRFELQDRAEKPARRSRSSFDLRVAALFRIDLGPLLAATAAGWRVDCRDPTTDRRIVEFCLSLPEDQYLRNGVTRRLVRRAFAGQFPTSILDPRRVRGRQAADFHEGMEKNRDEMIAEVDRMARSALAVRCLDLARMRRLLEEWPRDGWGDSNTIIDYRHALLRGVAAGLFIMNVEGGNA